MATPLPFYIEESDSPAKREILRAALKLFSDRGLAATSIRDIAKESGYTNPALYKHFATKEQLALYLFETCHVRVWSTLAAALTVGDAFADTLDVFVASWLMLLDEEPDVIAFLFDAERALWPTAGRRLEGKTLLGLARSLVERAPRVGSRGGIDPDVAAAAIQGTIGELARMIQGGVVDGPASRWQGKLVGLFGGLAG